MFGGSYFGQAPFGSEPAPAGLAATASIAVATVAALALQASLAAAPAVQVGASGAFVASPVLAATPTIAISPSAALRAGVTLAAAPVVSLSTVPTLVARSRFTAAPVVSLSTAATLSTNLGTATLPIITIDGVLVRVRRGSVTVHDAIDDQPNTCTLVVDNANPPRVGQALRIALRGDTPQVIFTGALQTVGESYEGGRPSQIFWPCTGIDDSPRANRKLPFGTWSNISATVIGQYIATLAGFTSVHVQADLPPISVNFDGSEGANGALTQIAKLIGGYFYWEDGDLHLFQEETLDPPDPLDALHPFLNEPPIQQTIDTSQLRTRNYGKGHGEATLTDVTATESIIPIADTVMFNPAGGLAITDTQRIAYTGVAVSGAGALVGPGAGPASAPTVAAAPGVGVTDGVHLVAYTDVTASGETRPSGLSAPVTTGVLATAPLRGADALDDPDGQSVWLRRVVYAGRGRRRFCVRL